MNIRRYKRFYLGLGITVTFLCASLLFPGLFAPAERAALTAEYKLRGESKVDSSIVILYLNNDDIDALGGMPLKRNYYALILSVLRELGAKAVGIDIGFTEPDQEHPEYDQVLASEIRSSGNVVLSGYFRSVPADETSSNHRLPDRLAYSSNRVVAIMGANGLELPIAELLDSTTAIGHTNFMEDLSIPMVLREGSIFVPSFSLELLRVSMGLDRSGVVIENDGLRLGSGSATVIIPFSSRGTSELNLPGGTGSLNVFPVVPFLKAYDFKSAGAAVALPVDVRGKIVLLGIIAEGRGAFVSTPFASRFPSMGIHAIAMDDALNKKFLTRSSALIGNALIVLMGLCCAGILAFWRERGSISASAVLVLGYVAAGFGLFALSSVVIPVLTPALAAVVVAVGTLIAQHRSVRKQLHSLSEDKESIARQLQQKEMDLLRLEQQLSEFQPSARAQEYATLQEEIRKYKDEIDTLRAQEDDLRMFRDPGYGEGDGRREFKGIVYNVNGKMADVVEFVKKISDSDATVLLLGESGTGKELVARALHQNSRRSKNAFIAVNCGALTETLLESELFGHEKGSFTGALKDKPGRFELAEGGTIFLDEIAETSEAFQVKLLRVLQEGTFERVGGTETHKANVRVISATNRDIKQAVTEKQFREDLYYRLNVFTLQLPPLRARVIDIPLLAEYFVGLEEPDMTISMRVVGCLQGHAWKGNVRELQSVIKRAVLLARSEGRTMLRTRDLPGEIATLANASSDIEEQIMESLREKKFSRNAISETAEELGGLNRGTVAEYLRGYCFKVFLESKYDNLLASAIIAGSDDEPTRGRVAKKIVEYLRNAVEYVDRSKPLEVVLAESRPKYKNLPQRYHPVLDEIISSYYRGSWRAETGSSEHPAPMPD